MKTKRLDNKKVIKHPTIIGDATLDTTLKVEVDNTQSIGEPAKQLQSIYARNLNTDTISTSNIITTNISSASVYSGLVSSGNLSVINSTIANLRVPNLTASNLRISNITTSSLIINTTNASTFINNVNNTIGSINNTIGSINSTIGSINTSISNLLIPVNSTIGSINSTISNLLINPEITNATVSNLRFNNIAAPLQYTTGNLSVKVDGKTIKISPDDNFIRIGSTNDLIKGWNGITTKNYTEYYDMLAPLGYDTDDIADMLDLDPQYLADLQFLSLHTNTDHFEFDTWSISNPSGPYKLNLKLPNQDCILYMDGSKIGGSVNFTYEELSGKVTANKIQGDYLTYTSNTLSNLKNTHSYSLNNGTINLANIKELKQDEGATFDLKNGNINELVATYIEGDDMYYTRATTSSLNVTDLNQTQNNSSFVLKTGTIASADIKDLKQDQTGSTFDLKNGNINELVATYIEGDDLYYTRATTSSLNVTDLNQTQNNSSFVLKTGTIASADIKDLKQDQTGSTFDLKNGNINELVATYIEGDDLYYTRATTSSLNVTDLNQTQSNSSFVLKKGSAEELNVSVLKQPVNSTFELKEGSAEYIDGDDLWYSRMTIGSFKHLQEATMGSLDIFQFTSTQGFIDGLATIGNLNVKKLEQTHENSEFKLLQGSCDEIDIKQLKQTDNDATFSLKKGSAISITITDTTPSVANELICKKYLRERGDDWLNSDLVDGSTIEVSGGKLKGSYKGDISTITITNDTIKITPVYKTSIDNAITQGASWATRLTWISTFSPLTHLVPGLGATLYDYWIQGEIAAAASLGTTGVGVGGDALAKANDLIPRVGTLESKVTDGNIIGINNASIVCQTSESIVITGSLSCPIINTINSTCSSLLTSINDINTTCSSLLTSISTANTKFDLLDATTASLRTSINSINVSSGTNLNFTNITSGSVTATTLNATNGNIVNCSASNLRIVNNSVGILKGSVNASVLSSNSFKRYPPIQFSSGSAALSQTWSLTSYSSASALYGLGTYTFNASSQNGQVRYAFDQFSSGGWSPATVYYGSTGSYIGTQATLDITGNTYGGEWIQMSMPEQIIPLNFTIEPSFGLTLPEFQILGSNNTSSWTLLTGNTQAGLGSIVLPSNGTGTKYSNYRLVFSKETVTQGNTISTFRPNTSSFNVVQDLAQMDNVEITNATISNLSSTRIDNIESSIGLLTLNNTVINDTCSSLLSTTSSLLNSVSNINNSIANLTFTSATSYNNLISTNHTITNLILNGSSANTKFDMIEGTCSSLLSSTSSLLNSVSNINSSIANLTFTSATSYNNLISTNHTTTSLRITDAIGIRTAPSYDLHVFGGRGMCVERDEMLGGGILRLAETYFGMTRGNWYINNSYKNFNIGFDGSSSINNVIVALTTGNVGIGTPNPTYKLDVNGTLYSSSITTGSLLATTNISTGQLSAVGSTIGTIRSTGITSGSILASNLDIKGTTSWGQIRIAPSSTGQESSLGFFGRNDFVNDTNSNAGWIMGLQVGGATGSFSFYRNSTTHVLTLGSTGNVGVGTITPSFKLDVNGNARISNGLTTGSLFTTSMTTGSLSTTYLGISSTNALELGVGVVGKEGSAGKIGYGTWDTNSLCIVGAGTSSGSRKVRVFDHLLVDTSITTGALTTTSITTSMFSGVKNGMTGWTNGSTNAQITYNPISKGYLHYNPSSSGTLLMIDASNLYNNSGITVGSMINCVLYYKPTVASSSLTLLANSTGSMVCRSGDEVMVNNDFRLLKFFVQSPTSYIVFVSK
jgi:hypothetical protein